MKNRNRLEIIARGTVTDVGLVKIATNVNIVVSHKRSLRFFRQPEDLCVRVRVIIDAR